MDMEWCVARQLVTTYYPSSTPLLGLYIAAATMVCFFCITYDSVHGLFIEKKPFLPRKLFTMNSFTIILLGLATKISVDQTTLMPRAEDQLSKLTSTALMCTSLGFYMPSLGTRGRIQRYNNMATLSVTVITMVFNICKQIETGVIFAFRAEHIIIMVCILLLLLSMWSSGISLKGLLEPLGLYFRSHVEVENTIDNKDVKDLEGLEKLLEKLHILNYTGNPQTLLCESANHHAFGFLCALSSVVVLQAMIRSIALKNLISCGTDVSPYKWSIPVVIVAQSLTIAVGTFSIIYRWLSFVKHTSLEDCRHTNLRFVPEMELVHLKASQLPFRFLTKKIPNTFLVAKDCILHLLIRTQRVWHYCNAHLIGIPIYILKKFIFTREHTNHQDQRVKDMKIFGLWSVYSEKPFGRWITKMALEDVTRWRIKRDCQIFPLERLISRCHVSSRSECALVTKLNETGKSYVQNRISPLKNLAEGLGEDNPRKPKSFPFLQLVSPDKFEYTFSFISLLALSGMLAQIMPSSRREFVKLCSQAFQDSFFEILYYVHKKTYPNQKGDQLIYTMKGRLIKELWLHWETPTHWFRSKILSDAFENWSLKNSKESKINLRPLLEESAKALDTFFKEAYISYHVLYDQMLINMMKSLIAVELSVLVEFIKVKKFKSVEHLFDFLEQLFVEMLYCILSDLPGAILTEIRIKGPIEMGEERLRKALKFCSELELLGENFKWSLPVESDRKGFKFSFQVGPSQTSSSTIVVAPDCGSEVEAVVSNVVDGIVLVDDDASLPVATTEQEDYGDTIGGVGSDEIV